MKILGKNEIDRALKRMVTWYDNWIIYEDIVRIRLSQRGEQQRLKHDDGSETSSIDKKKRCVCSIKITLGHTHP